VTSGDVDPGTLANLERTVTAAFAHQQGFEVISPEQLRKAIEDQHTIGFDDCVRAPSCLKRIGKKLGATQLVSAALSKGAGGFTVTMTRTNLADAKDVQTTTEKMKHLKSLALNVKLCLTRVMLADTAAEPATPPSAPAAGPKVKVIPDGAGAKEEPPSSEDKASSATAEAPAKKDEAHAGDSGSFQVQGFSSPPVTETPAAPRQEEAATPAAPEPAPAPAPPVNRANSVAVLDTSVQNVPPTLGALTTQTMSSYAANTLGMEVISKDDLRKLVSYQQLQQLVGCDTDTCNHAAGLSQSLGVQRILTSTLGRIGNRFQLSVVAMDTTTGKVVGRVTREIQNEEEILENARDLCHFALLHAQRDSKGYVRVTVNSVGAQIAIDGTTSGVSPLPVPARVAEGKHSIHVEKKGFLPFDGALTVEAGKEARVEVTLIAKSAISLAGAQYLPWAGATAGVALLGGAISIYGYETALARCKQYDLDSVLCASPGQLRVPLDSITLASSRTYIQFWGNGVGFYGGIASAVVGAASIALFTAYFITGLGAGGDEPPPASVHLDVTAAGPVLRF
jgi:hypothetical protein